MSGSRRPARKPILLVVVFGILLVLVGITATAQAVMVSAYASGSTFTSIVDGDVATLRGFVQQELGDFNPTSPDPASLARINSQLQTLLAKGGIAQVDIRTVDGRVLATSASGAPPTDGPPSADFAAAVAGTPRVAIVPAADAEAGTSSLPDTVLREYLPLRQGDRTLLVVGIWRDALPVLSQLDGLRRDVVIVTLSAAIIAAGVLFFVFRSAQATIQRQTAALVEATRLDALTDTPNHGALVGHLAAEIERARPDEARIGVALLDVDNFRLLNDNHGHVAGDTVLLTIAGAIRDHLAPGWLMGRYGPDEFLIIARGEVLGDLEDVVERIRENLAVLSLQFEASERLPLSVSAGICAFPDHGSSVTELLATAAATLHEARSSGGDAVRVAGTELTDAAHSASTFDVLQGLVFAVDAKDRYTKRHSEDVARYSVFLAKQIGIDPGTVQAIHTAGLLHDLGKIGIPDSILRKPASLTAEEYEVVKQHVALGDMIVRDLPDIDTVRAGVRHHHERWDGQGYLTRLAGEDIPLVARILAVGDAFSAMTTTRPYRKALSVREALTRLGDAAGTQLDASLVEAFIRGIETSADAPLPGMDAPSPLWKPGRRVA